MKDDGASLWRQCLKTIHSVDLIANTEQSKNMQVPSFSAEGSRFRSEQPSVNTRSSSASAQSPLISQSPVDFFLALLPALLVSLSVALLVGVD